MKVCIIGNSLTSLTLAKALVNKEIFVDIFYKNKNINLDKTRTIGISKSNIDFFNKEIHNIDYVFLRYFNACGATDIYGEAHNPETHLIPLILQVAQGKRNEIKLFGDDYPTRDGTCIRDYIHVKDLAQAHILALKTNISGVYNLGNGFGFSLSEILSPIFILSIPATAMISPASSSFTLIFFKPLNV